MDLSQESVVVDTTLASGRVQEILEGTGLKTILRGHGSGGGNLALQLLLFFKFGIHIIGEL